MEADFFCLMVSSSSTNMSTSPIEPLAISVSLSFLVTNHLFLVFVKISSMVFPSISSFRISVSALPKMALSFELKRMLDWLSIFWHRFLNWVLFCTYFTLRRVSVRRSRRCFGGM